MKGNLLNGTTFVGWVILTFILGFSTLYGTCRLMGKFDDTVDPGIQVLTVLGFVVIVLAWYFYARLSRVLFERMHAG